MEKQKLDVTMTLPYMEAVAYLEDMLESLKSGKVVVQKGTEFVSMIPGDQVTMELGAKSKKGKQKFSFEMSWTESGEGDLVISGKEPVFAAPAAEAAPEPAEAEAADDKAAEAEPEVAEKQSGKQTASKKTQKSGTAAKSKPARKAQKKS